MVTGVFWKTMIKHHFVAGSGAVLSRSMNIKGLFPLPQAKKCLILFIQPVLGQALGNNERRRYKPSI